VQRDRSNQYERATEPPPLRASKRVRATRGSRADG